MNSDGSNRKTLFANTQTSKRDLDDTFYLPVWSSDNHSIAFYARYITNTKNNQDELTLVMIADKGELIRKESCTFPGIDNYQNQSVFPLLDTTHLFSPNNKNIAYLKNIDTYKNIFKAVLLKNLKEELPLQGNIVGFRWSPDGNKLILLESKERNQINKLTLYDCTNNTYTPISQDVQQIYDVTWSPDGKQILYSGTDSKTDQIVFKTTKPDGSDQKVLFTFGENPQELPNPIDKIEKVIWLK